MKAKARKGFPRRDWCGALGRRMVRAPQACKGDSWHMLGEYLMQLEEKDVPNFWDLFTAIYNSHRAVRGLPPRGFYRTRDGKPHT